MMQSEKQAQILWSNYRALSEITEDDLTQLSQVLTELCPELDNEMAQRSVERLSSGIRNFRELYASSKVQGETDPQETVQLAAKGLNEQQRKGLYLQCYEFLRTNDAGLIPEAQYAPTAAELADQPEDKLLELVSQQLQNFSQQLAGGALSDADRPVPVEGSIDPLRLAAAAYAASVNGELPESFQRDPELVGACCAAREALTQELSQAAKDTDSEISLTEKVISILDTVLLVVSATVAITALSMAGAWAANIAINLVLSISASTLAGILTPILEVCLYGVAALAGLAAALGIIALPALGIMLAKQGWDRAVEFYRSRSACAKGTPLVNQTEDDLDDLDTECPVQA